MNSKDPFLWAALKLFQYQQQRRARPDQGLDLAADYVLSQAHMLARQLETSRKARARGWHAAAGQMVNRVVDTLTQLQSSTADALNHARHPPTLPQPTLRDLYQELAQLQQEFEQVNVNPKQRFVSAVTGPIELEGVFLGDFSIELHLDRLGEHVDASAFDVVAVDPHPPTSSDDVTHPHVRDNQLCAGDATNPIAQALRQGRICDAFLAVQAVLQNYNSASPYVSLSDWAGVACADCGATTNAEQLHYCEDCSKDYCDDCYGCCEICDRSCCRGCLEQDRESGRQCCRRCHHKCDRCGRLVDANDFDTDSGLCPACHEEFLDEQDAEEGNNKPKPRNNLMNNNQNDTGTIRAQKQSLQPPLRRRCDNVSSVLTFSPLAWLKLRPFLHADDVEIAGFGISAAEDLLYIDDFQTVNQTVTAVTAELDDAAVADHFDNCADAGIPPNRCGRIWIHTHPGTCPHPSSTDEQTFARVFGDCDWAVMAIIARGGASYARLRFSAGPGGHSIIPVRVDWERLPQELIDREGSIDQHVSNWMDEYGRNIHQDSSPASWSEPFFFPKLRPAMYPDPLEKLDELYDRQLLGGDDFALLLDGVEGSTQEVYSWE